MRTLLILGTGVDGRSTWGAPPLPALAWNIHDRATTDSLVEEAAGIAGVHAWLVLLRGQHDTGFKSEALMASLLAYRGPLATGAFPNLAPWIDTGALSSIAKDASGHETAFDFASDIHIQAFWTEFLLPFYARYPEGGRITHERSKNGRRLITWWGIKPSGRGIVNQHLAQRLLDHCNQRGVAAGLGAFDHVVDVTWKHYAPNLDVHGVHAWFSAAQPPNTEGRGAYSITQHNGITTGCAVPGFHVKNYPPIVPRRGGATVREAFQAFRGASCDYVILEGHTDDIEDAGWYRSSAWSPPTLYLDLILEHIQTAAGVPAPTPVPVPTPPPVPLPVPVPPPEETPVPLPYDTTFPARVEGEAIGFATEPLLSFRYGDLVKVGQYFAILYPAGDNPATGKPYDTVLSVQKDGSLQTRPRASAGGWEICRIIDGKALYQIDGRIYAFPIIEGLLK